MNNGLKSFNKQINLNFNCLTNAYINNISKFYINNIINKHVFINKTYSYDKNGNIILKNGVSLSYDKTIKDRLILIESNTIAYNLIGTFTGTLCSDLMDAINANDLLVDFFNRRPLDYF